MEMQLYDSMDRVSLEIRNSNESKKNHVLLQIPEMNQNLRKKLSKTHLNIRIVLMVSKTIIYLIQ